jgi:hypothetical protein
MTHDAEAAAIAAAAVFLNAAEKQAANTPAPEPGPEEWPPGKYGNLPVRIEGTTGVWALDHIYPTGWAYAHRAKNILDWTAAENFRLRRIAPATLTVASAPEPKPESPKSWTLGSDVIMDGDPTKAWAVLQTMPDGTIQIARAVNSHFTTTLTVDPGRLSPAKAPDPVHRPEPSGPCVPGDPVILDDDQTKYWFVIRILAEDSILIGLMCTGPIVRRLKVNPNRLSRWTIFTTALDPKTSAPAPDPVHRPAHYQGVGGMEVFDVIEAFGLTGDAYLMNVVKYVLRAGRKGKAVEDLRKAAVYLDRAIQLAEKKETR